MKKITKLLNQYYLIEEQRLKQKEQNFRDLWDNLKKIYNVHLLEVPDREEREWDRKLFEGIGINIS